MTKTGVFVNRLFLIGGILCLLFYFTQGIFVRFGQSLLFLWLLLGLGLLARHFLWRRAWAKGKSAPFPRWLLLSVRVLIALALAVFLWGESYIVSAAFQRPAEGLDAVLVLGAKVNDDGPSGALRERIEAAADYLRRNPSTLAIASGGKGEDEPVSEARCILDGLTAAGIDPERITLEDGSFNTLENITNSFALLPEGAKTVGIVTNDFHVYRAVTIAEKLGDYEICGIPARSSIPGFIHYAMREFFAVAVMQLRYSI